MKRKLIVLGMCILMCISMLCTGCAAPTSDSTTSMTTLSVDATKEPPSEQTNPKPELNVKEVYGKGPNGEEGSSYLALSLTDDERNELKKGNFKVTLNFHTLDNANNFIKKEVITEQLEEAGIQVLAITDGQKQLAKCINDIETSMTMEPDLIWAIVLDAKGEKGIFTEVKDAGIKMVFSESPPADFEAGKDYKALVTTDFYGNGRLTAEYMAWLLNYEGKVGMSILAADIWSCKQRDEAFRVVMSKYPGIEIVVEEGFSTGSESGTAADGIMAKYPDIDAVYATWDGPAISAVASAKSVGRNDLIITTVDLGDDSARMIASGDLLKFTASGSPYHDGLANAMVIMYSLIDKPLPSSFIATPSTGVDQTNVLEAYKDIFNTDPPEELVNAWKEPTDNK